MMGDFPFPAWIRHCPEEVEPNFKITSIFHSISIDGFIRVGGWGAEMKNTFPEKIEVLKRD